MRRIEVKGMYAYKGHNVSANGSVNLTLCREAEESRPGIPGCRGRCGS